MSDYFKLHDKVEDLIPFLRKILIKQSGLSADDVISVSSVRGPMPTKIDAAGNEIPYNTDEQFIIFDFSESNDINVATQEDSSGALYDYVSYELHLTIYGDYARTLAQQIKSRFQSEKVNNELEAEGVQVLDIDSPVGDNEFINNTFWIRSDLNISLGFGLKVGQIDDLTKAEAVQDIVSKKR